MVKKMSDTSKGGRHLVPVNPDYGMVFDFFWYDQVQDQTQRNSQNIIYKLLVNNEPKQAPDKCCQRSQTTCQ